MIKKFRLIFENMIIAAKHLINRRANIIKEFPKDPYEIIILCRLLVSPIMFKSQLNNEYDYFVYENEGVRITDGSCVPELKCWILEDCTILQNGLIITSDNQFLMINVRGRWVEMAKRIRPDLNRPRQLLKFLIHPIHYYLNDKIYESNHVSLYFTGQICSVYFHWVLEFLPSLRAAKVAESIGLQPKIVINSNLPKYVSESIEAIYGINSPEIGQTYNSSLRGTMIIPEIRPFSGNDYAGTVAEISFLRDQLVKPEMFHTTDEYIFSSREDADSRRILNRQNLLNQLNEFDLREYAPGNHNLKDQILTFANAELIVGPHGSNLTNIVFGEDLTVIEIIGDQPHNRCYEYISESLGFEHVYLNSKKISGNYEIEFSKLENCMLEYGRIYSETS